MSKLALYAVLAVGIFIGGFLTAKHYYNQNTEVVTDKKHTVITRIIVKNPDGTEKTVETIDETEKTKTKITTAPKPTVNLSALVATDFSQSQLKPTYGVSITKEVLGNITVGAFVLDNKTAGVSIGYNF